MDRENVIFYYVEDIFIDEMWYPLYVQASSEKGELAAKGIRASIEKGMDAHRLLDGIEKYSKKEVTI